MASNAPVSIEGSASSSVLGAALADVSKSICAAADVLTFVADPDELTASLNEIVGLRNQCDALVTQFTNQAAWSGAPVTSQLRTVGQWVAAHTNASPQPFRAAHKRGRWLRDFPQFEQAHTDKIMSVEHLEFLRLKIDNPRTHFILRDEQQHFVDWAADCSFDGFVTAANHWMLHIDPDGDEPKDQIDNARVSVRVGPGGRTIIGGELDALGGQAFRTALDKETNKLATSDKDNGVVRTEAQRRAAALVALVSRGAAREDGTYSTPLINIVMSQKVAEWALAQLADPTSDRVPVKFDDIDGRCELIDGTPIHPLQALSVFGIATFRRYILDAESRPIDISVSARSFPEWMRTALLIETRGRCTTPGCDAPHRWIQIDHDNPHSNGGQTSLENGQPHCAADNAAKGNRTGHSPWRHRQPPGRRHLRRRQNRSGGSNGEDSDEADHS